MEDTPTIIGIVLYVLFVFLGTFVTKKIKIGKFEAENKLFKFVTCAIIIPMALILFAMLILTLIFFLALLLI